MVMKQIFEYIPQDAGDWKGLANSKWITDQTVGKARKMYIYWEKELQKTNRIKEPIYMYNQFRLLGQVNPDMQ